MFGRGSLFDMLGDDFTRDPFFQDPFRYMQSQTGFPDPAEQLTAWSSANVPQRRGREVALMSAAAHNLSQFSALLWLTLGCCRCLLRPRAAVQHVVRHPSLVLALKRLMET